MSLKYRPEIDGLRAIAVLSVILFHLQVAGFAGGFIGVDVFFVISGYLITGIILQDYNAGRFTFADFYKRRIRRIIPLTIVVYAFTLLVSYWLFFSEQYKSINHILKSSLVFVSNFLFLRKPGYFDPSTQENPLLHTWSLSVEEQFYIFFPLVIYLLLRYTKNGYKYGLVAIAVFSFIANIIVSAHNPQKAFYWPHTRAWQLMCGAILATRLIKSTAKIWLNNAISIAGVLMIAACVLLFKESVLYPGWYALLPVAGSCCIIYGAVSGTLTHNMIASRPIVFIGKISYSLYMWHWPFWVFVSFLAIGPLGATQKLLLMITTLIVSYASYKLIEQPFRSAKAASNKFTVWGIIGSVVLLMFLALFFINNHDGIGKEEWKVYKQDLFSNGDKLWEDLNRLESENKKNDFKKIQACSLGRIDATASFILLGDSYARALAPGMDTVAKQKNLAGVVLSASLCPPISNVRLKAETSNLQPFMENSMLYIRDHPEVKTVILSARWIAYYEVPKRIERMLVPVGSNNANALQKDLLWYGLRQTLEQLKTLKKTVIIVAPIPELKATVTEMLVVQKIFGTPRQVCSPNKAEFLEKNKQMIAELQEIAGDYNAILVWAGDSFYGDSPYMQVDRAVYRDKNHLSEKASYIEAGYIAPYLN